MGPTISGVLAVFPTVFTSMMLILHPRIGGPATAAVLANGAYGMIGFTSGVAVLHVATLYLGSAAGLSLALATCVGWNLGLWWVGRRKITKAGFVGWAKRSVPHRFASRMEAVGTTLASLPTLRTSLAMTISTISPSFAFSA